MINRRRTRVIKIGNLKIGGNNPIAIQSMTKVKTSEIKGVINQINNLEDSGCEIVRLAVKDYEDAKAIKLVKSQTNIPLVADIHFDWRLALEAINNGIDKIRLNPGNIYKKEEIHRIVKAAKQRGIPIRVGVNSGSLRSHRVAGFRHGGQASGRQNIADKMVKDALDYIKIIEELGFYEIMVSLKASNITDTVQAYRKMAEFCEYPFHLGVTATGLPFEGTIKSSIAIGNLLSEGIGDTIRISLTDKPQEEVKAAKCILKALGLRRFGPEIISCPTCGRCEVNLIKIVKELEKKITDSVNGNCRLSAEGYRRPLKVAVMGCVVNGPGEAKEADIGVAFGRKEGLLFKKGRPVKKVAFNGCVDVLLKEIIKRVSGK